MKAFFLLLLVSGVSWAKPAMQFAYQNLGEPYDKVNCTYQEEPNLPYDYVVTCPLRRRTATYKVHVVISYYPKTIFGFSAYEILYWVVDFSNPAKPESHSSTSWIHQDTPNAKPTVFQLNQGIENDRAYLSLVIDNRRRS